LTVEAHFPINENVRGGGDGFDRGKTCGMVWVSVARTRRTSEKAREASNSEYRIQKAELRTAARMSLAAGMEAEDGFTREKLRVVTHFSTIFHDFPHRSGPYLRDFTHFYG
jgi:hypothetical protein